MNHNSRKNVKLLRAPILLIKNASPIEKLLFAAILFFFLIASLLFIERISNSFSVRIPIQGGVLKEGIVGFPSNMSPVTARSNADHDLVALLYSGLLKVDADGSLVPDLAESYSVSEDGRTYTFALKTSAYFHDSTPVTTHDVAFTIESIQNPTLESPLASAFRNVSVEVQSPTTVALTLSEPYAGFLAEMTIGIIPKHVWEGVTTDSLRFLELSSNPVGSGPFKVDRVERSQSLGVPTHYTLVAHSGYVKRPYLNQVELSFYQNEEELLTALKRGEIESAPSVSPSALHTLNLGDEDILHAPMLRTFGLFFNPSESSPLSERAVRRAVNVAIDRGALAESIFSGYALPTRTPFPSVRTYTPESNADPAATLDAAGWEVDDATGIRVKDEETLSFTIKTGTSSELHDSAQFLAQTLRPLGFDIDVETFDIATLNQSVIRGRDYEALLFGQAYSRFIDPYPFWHSSGRDDPGLNVARYASSDVDEYLSELRRESDEAEQIRLMRAITTEFEDTVPAVFLYVPDFLYIRNKQIKNIHIPPVERSSDRFSNIEDWFVYTDTVWKIFLKDEQK